ncbi:hypothetical protein Trydic_g13526 [Trypoxylus dichotomus]
MEGLRLLLPNFVFQQDNDPKHASKLCKDYLQLLETDGSIKVMAWSPQSPDLNPMELLREELNGEVQKAVPISEDDMWKRLQEAWPSSDPPPPPPSYDGRVDVCQGALNGWEIPPSFRSVPFRRNLDYNLNILTYLRSGRKHALEVV